MNLPGTHPPRSGIHHLVRLRAAALGVPVNEAARCYLGIEHGHEAITAHRAALDRVRAVARRRGDSRWRLLGATLPAATLAPVTQPSKNGPKALATGQQTSF